MTIGENDRDKGGMGMTPDKSSDYASTDFSTSETVTRTENDDDRSIFDKAKDNPMTTAAVIGGVAAAVVGAVAAKKAMDKADDRKTAEEAQTETYASEPASRRGFEPDTDFGAGSDNEDLDRSKL